MISKLRSNKPLLALLSTILFLLFVIFVLPSEANKSISAGINQSPDTMLYYTSTTLYKLAFEYGMIGRQFYVNQRFSFDLIWPLVYLLFLFSTTQFFLIKLSFKKDMRYVLLFSLLAFSLDILENIATATVMYRYPKRTDLLANLAGFFTLFKWITLSVSFIILLTLCIYFVVKKIKVKQIA